MRIQHTIYLAVLTTLLLGRQTPAPLQRDNLQQQLDVLTKRGFTYRLIGNDLIELTDPVSGDKHLKGLREPTKETIRSWAAQRGIPILEIDPSTVDTNKYIGWYTYFTTVPLSNGFGVQLVLGDLDGNGKVECYGAYDTPTTNTETRCYEIDSNGSVVLRHNYAPLAAAARVITDADADSLREVLLTSSGLATDCEQNASNSLPTIIRFEHNRNEGDDPGFTGIYNGSLDGNSLTDFLYKGSTPDSSKVFVAEYDPQANNFVRVWSTDYGLGGVAGIAGFAVDDFDGDGRMEFVVTEISYGRVIVTENVGNNQYAVTWQDTTPFANLDNVIGGDVDGDGKPEFFVGGDTFNGNWTIMYEADSNNHYSPRFMFHIVPDGFLSPTYLTTDVDGDGHPELVILSSGYLHVFKGSGKDQYMLWYFRHDTNTHSVQCYDVNIDGRKDIVVSKGTNDIGFFADVYKASKLVLVNEVSPAILRFSLSKNYPNPFNSVTSIHYALSQRGLTSLTVYDMLGRVIATLANGMQKKGQHIVQWDATNSPSGVYFCRLESEGQAITMKLLLLK